MTTHENTELAPEVAALLPVLDAGFPKIETMTGAQARAAIRARLRLPDEPELVAEIIERELPGGGGVRVYRPAASSAGPVPLIVFAHGGGFVFCDLDTHDGLCRSMANGVGAVVVSVDYRLAPEHRWPTAAEDVYATTLWAVEHAREFGADPARLAVAGDSAGGNLAAVVALMARDRGGPAITAQALLYPVLAADFGTDSYTRFGEGFYNTRAAMSWYWDQYVPDLADRTHPYASPAAADLAGLPPAIVVTAGCDPLRSEGDAYAHALAEAGVTTVHRCYEGAIHGFMTMPVLELAGQACKDVWADLTRLTRPDES
ncbi:alpha/beta hydrolase [Nocardia cyriacigeorgica]|uniref:Alpha/beta hydrolase n=1 Tax=Nocardia cyriacigeorgica TaxID=135487 RepID=A0A5R8P619_9NOCA|nr:alpha/beta hydrolase [Nocardia cyriacigeorgica]TLF96750.1 alpha/beta hydrolase [Nocardia cyriacigeorgica]